GKGALPLFHGPFRITSRPRVLAQVSGPSPCPAPKCPPCSRSVSLLLTVSNTKSPYGPPSGGVSNYSHRPDVIVLIYSG
ncbi:hypothetical protein KUCAC02_023679, partial [Chaenocephalus aceratus]